MNFDDFKLHPTLLANVVRLGYRIPTPIQRDAIPPVMDGSDVVGLAQTGTGKTAAFALPVLHRLLSNPAKSGVVRALVVAPTRELAEQIYEAFGQLGKNTKFRSCTVYGGVNIKPQIQKLRDGVEIVISCPGRLLDHVEQGTIDLSHVEVLILDEADRMFDMGFLPSIRRILKIVPQSRQTLLFSATMPDDVRRLSADALKKPVTVQIDFAKAADTVSQALYPIEHHLKTDLLLEILKTTNTDSVIVFTAAKHRAKRLGEKLIKAGYRATSLQGNLSQNRRQEALDGFRSGEYQIMVATDVASRGIDVATISHVINYDMPDTVDAYTHRIGRTGRAARLGDAITFVTDEDYPMVKAIEKAIGTDVDRRYIAGFDYKAPKPDRDIEFARAPREQQRRPSANSHSQSRPSAAAPRGRNPRPDQPRRPGPSRGRP